MVDAGEPNPSSTDSLDAAVSVLRAGKTVVYPTETVYGLGADATDATAVRRVFEHKGRDRSKPVSVGFPDREAVVQYVSPTDRERAFMRAFLPGPVTVLVDNGSEFPAVLTPGGDRVGIRIPDNAVARELARRVGPITATSANVSGSPSVRTVDALSPAIRDAVGAVIDTGETPGGESTVVDVDAGVIHRRGALADEIEAWLSEH